MPWHYLSIWPLQSLLLNYIYIFSQINQGTNNVVNFNHFDSFGDKLLFQLFMLNWRVVFKEFGFSFKIQSPKSGTSLNSSLYLTTVDWSRNVPTCIFGPNYSFDSSRSSYWGQIILMCNFWATVFWMGNYNCFCF